MASVRDMLQGKSPSPSGTGQVLQEGEQSVGPKLSDKEPVDQKAGLQSEMADRLRQAAQRRVELARLEVDRRQDEVMRQEQRLSEAVKHDLPSQEVMADINEAKQRLNEAQFDLTRAEEAQLNTELATQEKISGPQPKLGNPVANLADDKKPALDVAAKPSVRDQLKSFFSRKDTSQGNNESVAVPKVKL